MPVVLDKAVKSPVHEIGSAELNLERVKTILQKRWKLALSPAAKARILHCRAYLDQKLASSEQLFYGINTGFGYLQNVRINRAETTDLQYNLLQSHACGLGEEVPADIVRLMLLFKIEALSQGYSAVQLSTVERLIDFFNHDLLPIVYTQGSLGASGDLAPLSHLSLPLIGLGTLRVKGKKMPAAQVLAQFHWEPIALQAKEGIALINGTQFMLAYGFYNLMQAERALHWADLIATMSIDAFDGSLQPFHERLHQIRPHPGQINTAAKIRQYLLGSAIAEKTKEQVQDPYSFRCIPQVHGASKDVFAQTLAVMTREANSVTDNPNVFPDDDLILSGGNFHGQPLAMALDFLSIAMAEIGSISERRTYQLLSGQRGLPLFLIKNPGLHSGLMIPQYTAAGIVSENKQRCTPASVDSIVSSNGQEDHVSMGANAAVKCARVLNNVDKILAIELLSAAQALEFRRPLHSSPVIEDLHAAFRSVVSFNEQDRILADDLQESIDFLNRFSL
ncbi:histidine ammonia-lyase [Haliscomenobacter hydrossis]|uniref:Histidine ammonia-lyase n=1 Tax=Haliscomenobacter hydrossis (strain ATCC 27775 / DSM 1100 / LMG 10767 / O) TaxID=760192 RepID=F4L5I0_HALH1|nr:histidine ammonia-lyase [Haliscomenobacter hydrossis]AEE50844.1 histidine ammonia-lyase [Haliscomenobacter hydrossis DSM 1100]